MGPAIAAKPIDKYSAMLEKLEGTIFLLVLCTKSL